MEKIANNVKKLNFDPKITEEIAIENEHEIWANTMHSRGLEQAIIQNKTEITKKMLNDSVDTDVIIKYTSLTKEEVENLR